MARYHERRMYDNGSRTFINIDNLLQVFSSAEKAEGLPETFKQIEPTTPKKNKCGCNCGSGECESVVVDKKKTPFACGDFDMSLTGDAIDDDDNDVYVCYMCDKLGYSQSYTPEICDTCKACAGCNEYIEEECSGCSYSVYRDGEYYHDKLPESELVSEHDLDLFKQLEKPQTTHLKRCDGVGKFRNR